MTAEPTAVSPRGAAWWLRRTLAQRWDAIAVVLLATWVLWPIPIEVPRSQDHTVHLARAWIIGQNLASGHITGWSSTWFFGFPAGELYPVLGDLAVAAVRGATLGLLPWAHCYAVTFWIGYVLGALAIGRIGRAVGWGPWPGLVAAALFVLDPGETREGGFRFTVFFGVWLQPLAVAWTWCAVAELHAACQRRPLVGGALVRPCVLVALALLAHPITMPLLAVLLPLWVLAQPRDAWIRSGVVAAAVAGLALGAAAWFLAPMIAHRAWMASFGALHRGLSAMLGDVASGAWAGRMAAPVGWTITAGVVWSLVRGDRFARFVAAAAVLVWLLACREALWIPRLDRLADGFRALQYQRFVMCAKPGLFLAAGVVLTAAVRAVYERRSEVRTHAAVTVAAVLCASWVVVLVHATARATHVHGVGVVQIGRSGDADADAQFERDWALCTAWIAARWTARDRFFRVAYETESRHGHGLADAPVYTGAPAYKIGSTPGETFVHRPESDSPAVLDRLRVRYLVTLSATPGAEVARFGPLRVLERPLVEGVARVIGGGGTLTVVHDDPDGEGVVVDVDGSGPGSRLVFAVAGYPRWSLLRDGEAVEWVEVPVVGGEAPATQQSRRAGDHVEGRADRTLPSEPMLIAADGADGRWELRYRRWLPVDIVAVIAAALAIATGVLARRRSEAFGHALEAAAARLHPLSLVVVAVVLAVAPAVRWLGRRAAERPLASAWLRDGRAVDAWGMRACAMEIARVIGPTVCLDPATTPTAQFPGIIVGEAPIDGYVAIEDGTRERASLTVEVSARQQGGTWSVVFHEAMTLARGKRRLAIALDHFGVGTRVDLQVRIVVARGASAPRLGLDLTLPE